MSVEAFDPKTSTPQASSTPIVSAADGTPDHAGFLTLNMSKEASDKVLEFMSEETADELFLRIFVQGGGCSGFQYGFTFDEEMQDDDTMCNLNGLKIIVDPLSIAYINGATIEYQVSIAGARFQINNPNASTTCGCGSSFSV